MSGEEERRGGRGGEARWERRRGEVGEEARRRGEVGEEARRGGPGRAGKAGCRGSTSSMDGTSADALAVARMRPVMPGMSEDELTASMSSSRLANADL